MTVRVRAWKRFSFYEDEERSDLDLWPPLKVPNAQSNFLDSSGVFQNTFHGFPSNMDVWQITNELIQVIDTILAHILMWKFYKI